MTDLGKTIPDETAAPAAAAAGAQLGGSRHITWPPELPFALVLERARALDSAALTLLYRRFLPVVYRYALARIGDVHAAEDITSETFSAMVEGIAALRARDELGFSAWLLGIARNQAAMQIRRRQTRHEQYGELPESRQPHAAAEAGDPLAVLTARESWSETVAALNRLTDEQRAVVLYRCVLGFSTDEVATLLQKQPGTIRALQFRALASLARQLGTNPDTAPAASVAARKRRGSHEPRR
ncbi:MAG TPA: RNA polymerase sigma factor [Ktedonobacterales bacterium]|nr:RNA polymerase sigma factor [Ktedonobacterales bacterium]